MSIALKSAWRKAATRLESILSASSASIQALEPRLASTQVLQWLAASSGKPTDEFKLEEVGRTTVHLIASLNLDKSHAKGCISSDQQPSTQTPFNNKCSLGLVDITLLGADTALTARTTPVTTRCCRKFHSRWKSLTLHKRGPVRRGRQSDCAPNSALRRKTVSGTRLYQELKAVYRCA